MSTNATCPVDWREISMKQSVGKCKQINFWNLCVNISVCCFPVYIVGIKSV